ncbi:tetratricopeptide repeat-containing serine protease family protein [Micromonospora tulbaghiae]|uniref:tetratricopeptide repeat-containing S1 family peptidase n=1 Tax=Micromonospora tulbaghiae TaxID=479978 RepID=UPI0029C20B95|nr:tetratricopeptide repeat protein [Micromonospora tulbaghiae]MDX5461298.1 tetratricopeptide repeat protein [Micromonospora tulbaghiae]
MIDFRRAVEVLVVPKVEDARPGYGSGFGLGAGLVLTCAHIFSADRAAYDVVLRDTAGAQIPASVAWVARSVDLALLRLENPTALPTSTVPIRALRTGTGSRLDFVMYGWPRAGDVAGATLTRREPVEVTGEIRLAEFAGTKTGLLRLRPTESYPSMAGGSYWQGMSGAAVFCQGAVIATQVSQPQRLLTGYLHARPLLPEGLATPDDNGMSGLDLLADVGSPVDLHAFIEDPAWADTLQHHRNVLFGGPIPEAPARPADPLPSWWLDPRNHAVDFIPPPEFEEMLHWCVDDVAESPPVRLLYAPGGTGKTRFGIELAVTLQRRGWTAGLISSKDTLDSLVQHLRYATDDGIRVFAAVDYAETGIDRLRDLLTTLAATRSGAARVLLLARSPGRWWDGFAVGTSAYNMMNPEPFTLTTVELSNASQVFSAAYVQFRRELLDGVGNREAPAPPDVARPRVLDLHAAALAKVLDERRGTHTPGSAGPLESVLAHERHYWRLALLQEGVHLSPNDRLLDRLLAAPTLHPARTFDEAHDAISRVVGSRTLSCPTEDLTRLLAELYPPDDDRHYWRAIVPDRLGEALIARTMTAAPTVAVAGRESAELLDGADVATAIHALTVLARVAGFSDQASAAETSVIPVTEVIRHLLQRQPEAFLPAIVVVAESIGHPSELSDLAAASVHTVDLPTLNNTARRLPPFHTGLLDLAVTVERERVARLARHIDDRGTRNQTQARVDLAIALNNLALRLAAVGKQTEAYAQAERSLRITERTAGNPPEVRLLAAEAAALDTQARLLSATGALEQAVRTAGRAVGIYRKLSSDDPASWVPHLVTTLHNLGVQQASSGLHREALTTIEEATSLYCQLSATSARWKGELISALNSLGDLLAQLGLPTEALTISAEAERLARASAEDSPAVWLPDHASALNWLGIRLAAVQRYEEAASASAESVELFRRLVDVNPAVWREELATALNNLALRHGDLNETLLALECAEEAVRIRGTRRRDDAVTDTLSLAQSLGNLANCLAARARYAEALAVVDDAIELCHERHRVRRGGSALDLPMLLANRSAYLAALNRHRDAMSAATDALGAFRAATNDIAVTAPELSILLRTAGHRHRALGLLEESEAFLNLAARMEAGFVNA